ncbi:zinc-dependent metalloprotease [Wenyingzhuangia sp. 2_MG-2023]|uniref:zinc-dependent metalloprotease n=1 Tax=Wenyingzhuangia sp. 2_MG-2023 TaxID=3062639 RepID=UPI0026E417AE|nr:zinc-dependent metalloprotease [Wenyingzhuangia sp. 2_MG-2023]MDO6738521.1 zinc-dependent metalloprotease [Wenyingzhuangia sp. 2_MG-2023]
MKRSSLKGNFFGQFLILLVLVSTGLVGFSQDKIEKDDKEETEKKDSIKSADSKELNYQKFVKEGNVKKGLFNVYTLKEDYYFEIPDSLMSRDLLVVNKVSSVPYELNGHGLNKGMTFETKLVRFYRDTVLNKVWVKTINPRVQSPENDAITLSVKDNFKESIIEEFSIEAKNEDSTAVFIKVNKIFNGKEKSFSDVLTNIGLGGSIKTNLSILEKIKSFPKNIVVKSLLTTSVSEGKGPALPLSIGVTTNIVLLPTQVMKPRFSDKRIGFFSIPMEYYSDSQHQVETRHMITRWNLEPKKEDIEKYKKGELVEPKEPIVYYLDPATPKQWRPYIKQGVYDWNVAFEAAGFKNAIKVKFPSDKDVDFDADDVRYSVITYAASEKQNAMGPSIVDPRSGQILESDIIWWHNLMKGLHSWIRVQTGPIDEKARANKFSDEHMGEAIRFVSSHEVGHTFGLKHNMGASFSYPVDSLRSKTFTARMGGTAPSIMDYARFNYVAQPEDEVTDITPKIGVYDKYAIDWGYRWMENKSAHEELPVLNQWIRKHENDPMYFYGPQQPGGNVIDPRSQSEDLGDNAVKASTYGLQNLKRIMPNILSWTEEEGQDYYKASKLYKSVIDQWELYNNHVMANIGGMYVNNTVYGDGKNTYSPVPAQLQKEALNYLIENAILPQKWLFTPEINNNVFAVRDAPDGERYYSPISMLRIYQTNVIYRLIHTDRLMRITENEILNQKDDEVFTEQYLFDKLFETIFKKTQKGKSLDMFERITQKNYIDVLTVDRNKLLEKTKEKKSVNNSEYYKNIHFSYLPRVADIGTNKRAALEKVLVLLEKKRKKGDRATQAHYSDLIARITYNLKN